MRHHSALPDGVAAACQDRPGWPHYVLADTNSTNGTFVNGRRLDKPYVLKDHDLIGLSSHRPMLRFKDFEATIISANRFNSLRYDEQSQTFFLKQKPVDLTSPQFRLLRHLYRHAGRVCTEASCVEAIWGLRSGWNSESLKWIVNNLRYRLRQIDAQVDLIEVWPGLGYGLNFYPLAEGRDYTPAKPNPIFD